MKKSSKLLHSLLHSAIRFPAKFSSPPVAPWPPLQSSFDGWFSGELDALRLSSSPSSIATSTTSISSTRWLLCAFDLALAAQKTAIKSINIDKTIIDREIIEEHLEDVIDLLDMCNSLRETIENVKNYVSLLRIMLHWLEGNNSSPNKTGLRRARDVLSSCEEMERKFSEIIKCRSFSFGKKQVRGGGAVHESVICEETEMYEALNGSKAITSLACGALNRALSLKPKRGGGGGLRKMKSFGKTTSCWSVSFQELLEEVEKSGKFSELRDTVMAVKQLRNLVSKEMKDGDNWEKELRVGVEGLKRSCEGIEGEIVKPLEGKMDQLYKDLISVRLGLLGILSQTQTGLQEA